jgi:hypothetical protein
MFSKLVNPSGRSSVFVGLATFREMARKNSANATACTFFANEKVTSPAYTP